MYFNLASRVRVEMKCRKGEGEADFAYWVENEMRELKLECASSILESLRMSPVTWRA